MSNLTRIPTDMIEDRVTGQKLSSQLADIATKKSINVKYPFGTNLTFAKGDGTNETTVLQTLIDYAYQHNLNVEFPAGNFMADMLIPHDGSSWFGAGQGLTTLTASVSSQNGFIKMVDTYPVKNWNMKGFRIKGQGSSNPNQNGLHFDAVPQTSSPYTGGIWYSRFEDLIIDSFHGNQIYLNCQDGLGDMANQFLTFVNVITFREDNTTSRCLKATGQFGQTTFINCQFDGKNRTTLGTNVELRSLATGNDQVYSIKFDLCTFQESNLAVLLYNTLGVRFESCYFEELNNGVDCQASSYVSFDMPRFAQVSNGGNGYCIQGSGSSVIHAYDIFSVGTIDTIVKSVNSYIDYSILYGKTTSSGITANYGIDANGSVNIGFSTIFLLNTSTTHLKNITDNLATGSVITLVAWGGGQTVILDNTGNIKFSSSYSILTIPDKATVTMMKSDLGINGWVVIGTTGTFS